jgi:chaperonin GroES
MNLKPLDDRIVVKPSEAEQTTASGLVIPDTAKEKPQQGTVLAVGPGRWSDSEGKFFPLEVKVGDTVLYSKYGGTEVAHKGDDLLILTSRDVLAIVTKYPLVNTLSTRTHVHNRNRNITCQRC